MYREQDITEILDTSLLQLAIIGRNINMELSSLLTSLTSSLEYSEDMYETTKEKIYLTRINCIKARIDYVLDNCIEICEEDIINE